MNNYKYILTYIVSLLAIIFIWNISPDIDKEPKIMEQISENARVIEPKIQYVQAPKGFFSYINEILTTVIGLINIITFAFQVRNNKRSKTWPQK
tara:strand:- start:2392 stop:2673 length:282 start_codon:yes stop_codon:yes gene_type:complete